jgi:hypothetical protein
MLSTLKFHLTQESSNRKTGEIPVSSSPRQTCPASCPFAGGNGCYGDNHGLNFHWDKVSDGSRGVNAGEFFRLIAALLPGTLWRHNQVGDLPATAAGKISRRFLKGLIAANKGKRGYTYSHHDLSLGENLSLLRMANRQGFTVNASTETESAADSAIASGLPAVLTVASTEQRITWPTAGGNRVVTCPAQRVNDLTCKACELCFKRPRKLVIAFVAHGSGKNKVNAAIS